MTQPFHFSFIYPRDLKTYQCPEWYCSQEKGREKPKCPSISKWYLKWVCLWVESNLAVGRTIYRYVLRQSQLNFEIDLWVKEARQNRTYDVLVWNAWSQKSFRLDGLNLLGVEWRKTEKIMSGWHLLEGQLNYPKYSGSIAWLLCLWELHV